MGWHDGHLHAFTIGGEQFGDRHSVDDVADENRVTLNGLLRSPVVRFAYTYDFGDNWEHTVAFEKSEPVVEGVSYPICITGKRNCPPEDCGGVWGYEEMLAILANPTHPCDEYWNDGKSPVPFVRGNVSIACLVGSGASPGDRRCLAFLQLGAPN